ncbi:hypothetical protein WG68_15670 [Arsukibacterium ikkense]|uniref:Uncharacterized protein n=1 Tax=Arsukibacterium ikkense TaxID=336831 RepID=A0A0M2V4C1_9GAMM|nr:hypothetical protein [Arsukibacterium ikkense]KKO44490.1 hypothetical protein WG68_15670 [Arsukibacterium ikkense]
MKTFAALTLTAVVCLTAAPAQANPVTDAMQQLAANQLADIKITVVQQARQAMEKTAADLRLLLQSEPQLAQQQAEKTDTKPAAE